MTITDYLAEDEYACTSILNAIWHDFDRATQLKQEIERESKIVESEYSRAIHIQNTAEDADDLMGGVGLYWDNYFGLDKEVHQKNDNYCNLVRILEAREFSLATLSGSLLALAKKGLSMVYGEKGKGKNVIWPHGKNIGSQPLSTVIRQARNQSMHIDEAIKNGNFGNSNIESCFRSLENDLNNKVFSEFLTRDMSFEIIKALGWKTFNDYKSDMETIQ